MESTSDPFLSVLAPAYNEAKGIQNTVLNWSNYCDTLPFRSEIIIVDDGSNDGTSSILQTLSLRVPRLKLVSLNPNQGYGAALTHGFTHCQGQWVLTLDSDDQFMIEDFRSLWGAAQLHQADCVVGIRSKSDTQVRVVADKIFRGITRLLFGLKLNDPNCAIRLCRSESMRAVSLHSCGFALPTEIVLKLRAARQKIVEVPVRHRPRMHGESKLPLIRGSFGMLFFLLKTKLVLKKDARGTRFS